MSIFNRFGCTPCAMEKDQLFAPKRSYFACCIFICSFFASSMHGQNAVSFEHFGLPADTALVDSGTEGMFHEGQFTFHNEYNATWSSWSGWAISTKRDSISPGYTNDLSAITAYGYQSPSYAVAYVASGTNYIKVDNQTGVRLTGLYLTNSTYAYRSMLDGDAFAKKFGGLSGTDPDFFKLTIQGMSKGVNIGEPTEVYLADFRSDNSSEDFILKDWKYVPLNVVGADSLSFVLSSSDNGAFGMNTPAYFCIDQIEYTINTDNQEIESQKNLVISPNPATEYIQISTDQMAGSALEIHDTKGQLVLATKHFSDNISIIELNTGLYSIKIIHPDGIFVSKFIKL